MKLCKFFRLDPGIQVWVNPTKVASVYYDRSTGNSVIELDSGTYLDVREDIDQVIAKLEAAADGKDDPVVGSAAENT